MSKVKVLIVDDEPSIVEIAKALLQDIGYEVFTAENGEDGLNCLKEHVDIDCVISDINMPVMDGIDFIKGARDHSIEIPFIFFTGHGDHELLKEGVKYGAFDFINKPDFTSVIDSIAVGVSNGFGLSINESPSALSLSKD